ncbi:MAG TPA: hypothetical protein VF666_21075 [Pyrinomonadaceae bacterium]|jgi:hypothetical protein
MKNTFKTLFAVAFALAATLAPLAQRTTSVSTPPSRTGQADGISLPKPPPAPATVKAKYEGGLVGYGKTDGTLTFDDVNSRLLFRDKKGTELFSVPYHVVMAAYADTQSRRPTAATVAASTVPFGLGLPALFIKKKYRYLTLNYRDEDTRAEGVASFKLENKELLASVVYTLAEKAGLTQRGDAFVRRREPTSIREVPDQP